MVRITLRHMGRVSLPKAAPELRLFRAPTSEARGERKRGRKKERKKGRKEERKKRRKSEQKKEQTNK